MAAGVADAEEDGVSGDFGDVPDVAVVDVEVVVVAGLDDFVADAEVGAVAFDLGFELVWWVEGLLEDVVEVGDAGGAAVHGGEDLDVVERVEFEFVGDAVADEVGEGFGDGLRCGAFDEEEVFDFVLSVSSLVFSREAWELAVVDGVGGLDDLGGGSLAEDFGEACDGDGFGIDDVAEDVARADGGELVDVADDEQVGVIGECLEEGVHEWGVDHGCLVEDVEVVAGELVAGVAGEAFAGLELEEAVEGEGFEAGGFGHAFGGAAGGSCQGGFATFLLEDG